MNKYRVDNIIAFTKILKTIESCENKQHLNVALNLLRVASEKELINFLQEKELIEKMLDKSKKV